MMQTQRAERVDYAASIQLLAMERGEPIAGYTANLSESGMFVTVPCPFTVGTRVTCELPIPGDRLHLQGEVRWVQEVPGDDACSPMMGVGIQFTNLSAGSVEALRRFVTERRGSLQTVAVQFEGYGRPIRARAQLTDQGLQLWTALPFLRLKSPVNVAFDQPAHGPRSGVLDQVLLSVEQGVPRLKIDVSLERPDPTPGEAESGRATASGSIVEPPRPRTSRTISEELAAPLVSVSGAAEIDDHPLSGVVDDAAAAEPAWADEALGAADRGTADPAATLLVVPPPYEQFWRGAERRRRWVWVAALAMAAAAIASLARPQLWSGIADGLWPARSVAASAKETAAQIAAQAAEAQAELTAIAAQGPSPAKQDTAAPTPTPARAAPVKPAPAPAAPIQPAPAPTARAQARPSKEPAAAPEQRGEHKQALAAPIKRAPTAAAPIKPAPAPAARAQARPSKKPAAAPEQHGKHKQALAEKVGELKLTRGAAGVTLEIPIAGSIAGESHYVLSAPEGVAINLPKGAPGLPLGHYSLDRDGYKAVWIREREGGIQVRVFFPASRVPHEVQVERGRIRVLLSE